MKPIKINIALWHNAEGLSFMQALFSELLNDLCFWRTNHHNTDHKQQLKLLLEQYYQAPCLLLNSARSGLLLALEHAKSKQPDKVKVLYPSYICSSVPDTILAAGLIAVAVPVNHELNLCPVALAQQLPADCLAVIAPHMYGVAADIEAIEKICTLRQVILIDDAAQVVGIDVNGRPLGTFGDFGLLSFAQAKTIVTGVRGSGGVCIDNKHQLGSIQLRSASSFRRCGALWHFWASYLQQGNWQKLDYYWQRLQRKLGLVSSYYPANTAITNADAAIASQQFATVQARLKESCAQATLMHSLLQNLKSIRAIQLQPNRYMTRLIIQTTKITPKQLAAQLAAAGIQTKFTYQNSSKAFDHSFNSGLLELPWQGLTKPQVQELSTKLQQLDQQTVV